MVWLLHRTARLAVLVNFQLPSDRAFYAPSFPSHVENLGHPRSARVTTKSKQERSRPYLENSKLSQHCYISKRWNMWMAWHSESRWFGSLRPYTVFHPIVVEFSCVLFLTQPVCIVQKQNTMKLLPQADKRRCTNDVCTENWGGGSVKIWPKVARLREFGTDKGGVKNPKF